MRRGKRIIMKNFARCVALVFSALLSAAGCRTVSPPASRIEVWTPPEWVGEEQASDPTWTSIREQKIDAAEPLSLARLIDTALSFSPATRQAWEEARAAAAGVGQAESDWYPTLTVSAEGDYQKQHFTLKDESAVAPSSDTNELNYGPNFKITYLLLDFGGRSAAIEEATQQLLATNFTFNRAIQDLFLAVGEAYYELYSAQANVEAGQADVEDAKTALEAARRKFQVGLVSKLDELQAQSSYDDSLYSLEDARGAVKSARANLARFVGFPADTPFEIVAPEKNLPTEISREDVSRLIEEALKKRPDIAAQRAVLRASEAAVAVADSGLWPELSIGGTAGRNWYEYYGGNELYDDSYAYTGYVSLGWDLFSGFYDLNAKRLARATAAAEREKLVQAEVGASAEVWTKYYDFNTAVKKLAFSRAFLDSAQASYDLALQGYDSGLKSILDLLQGQSGLSTARSRLIEARKDVFVALAELAHATGSLSKNSY